MIVSIERNDALPCGCTHLNVRAYRADGTEATTIEGIDTATGTAWGLEAREDGSFVLGPKGPLTTLFYGHTAKCEHGVIPP